MKRISALIAVMVFLPIMALATPQHVYKTLILNIQNNTQHKMIIDHHYVSEGRWRQGMEPGSNEVVARNETIQVGTESVSKYAGNLGRIHSNLGTISWNQTKANAGVSFKPSHNFNGHIDTMVEQMAPDSNHLVYTISLSEGTA
jgi:hypothetical protein